MNTTSTRATMNGKPVFTVPSKTIINFDSGFKKKLLCDGPTFSTGTACVYDCSFCYVPAAMKKQEPWLRHRPARGNCDPPRKRRVSGPQATVVETGIIPKSKIDHLRCASEEARQRIIYGVSTGTLDDILASVFEQGTALVSKRLASLHWLQDNDYRTFGMICPSLPGIPGGYNQFARSMYEAIRGDRCEHVWAEVINVRGESMTRTVNALKAGSYFAQAKRLEEVSLDKNLWEQYARETFEGHAPLYKAGQLRYLQYLTNANAAYWESKCATGAVLL